MLEPDRNVRAPRFVSTRWGPEGFPDFGMIYRWLIPDSALRFGLLWDAIREIA